VGSRRKAAYQQPLVHEILGPGSRRCTVLHLLTQDVSDGDVDEVVLWVLWEHCLSVPGVGGDASACAATPSVLLHSRTPTRLTLYSAACHSHPVHDFLALRALSRCRGTGNHDLERDRVVNYESASLNPPRHTYTAFALGKAILASCRRRFGMA
jgi:hypothetical protein